MPEKLAPNAVLSQRVVQDALTFDDVLLLPRCSSILPNEIEVGTTLAQDIRLNIPLVSAAMDTVTESRLAIAIAQEGGIGIIHKNLDTDAQCREVHKVKRSESGVILDPVTLAPNDPLSKAKEIMSLQNISGVPILGDDGRLAGIITRRDMTFLENENLLIRDVMTSKNLITGPSGTSLEEAERILKRAKVEKLLLIDKNNKLTGLITMRDIDRSKNFPVSCKDARGRLRVGAAVGVHDYERVASLIKSGVDVVVVDTAHGHSANVLETVKGIRKKHSIAIVAGNIATADAAKDLIAAGADALKVGIGPGSICTTRVVSGVGVPQVSAIMNVCSVAAKSNIPVIADGGIRQSGDITKALAAGAHTAMIGSLFAGVEEAPGETVTWKGRRFKEYRGMGSLGAMIRGSADRYGQSSTTNASKLVPEGVEGRVPYRGPLSDFVYQLVGGVRAGMGYCGTKTLDELRDVAQFCRISAAGAAESHPHDVAITKESPNYAQEQSYG